MEGFVRLPSGLIHNPITGVTFEKDDVNFEDPLAGHTQIAEGAMMEYSDSITEIDESEPGSNWADEL